MNLTEIQEAERQAMAGNQQAVLSVVSALRRYRGAVATVLVTRDLQQLEHNAVRAEQHGEDIGPLWVRHGPPPDPPYPTVETPWEGNRDGQMERNDPWEGNRL